uniref:Ferric-chelate reductase 1 n=1 Tax=Arion vulgaris TaxID=1028688 RepID=A0A0B7A764_9EUPU
MRLLYRTYYILPFLMAVSMVTAYPIGAPSDGCLTMFPKHSSTDTQLERDVYVIRTVPNTYRPGQEIKITVNSPRGKLVKGIQIRAHRTEFNTEEVLGTYKNMLPEGKLRYISCFGQPDNMVTHNTSESVPEVEMTWIAPDVNVGPIIFEFTVVESFFVFYHGLKSEIINPAVPSQPIIYPAQIDAVVDNENVAPIDWDACGETKGCLLYPRYCTGTNCKVAASYVINATSDTATFELMVQGAEYVALGFSEDMTMGADQTISCSSVYDRVNIQHGWNHPFKYNVQDLRANLTELEATRNEDGVIYCRFTRPVRMDIPLSYDEFEIKTTLTLTFDLNNEYYLFLAWGSTYETTDILGYHYEMPVMSETKVDFFDHSTYRGSVMSKLMRAHSTMMAVAWLGFAVLTIIMARHYKDGFSDKKICGIKIWFHIHRIAAILTFVLTVAGIIVVLVKLEGKITVKKSAHTHMCLGFTVVSLVCAQLLGGLIRPDPSKKFRPIFNFVHRLLGTAALIIAAATIIYAYKIADFHYEAQQFGERTVAVWAGILVFLEILHTGYKYFATTMCVRTSHRDEYNLDKESETEATKPGSPSYIIMAISLLFIACSITAAFCMTLFF